jgi:hypothetical protein
MAQSDEELFPADFRRIPQIYADFFSPLSSFLPSPVVELVETGEGLEVRKNNFQFSIFNYLRPYGMTKNSQFIFVLLHIQSDSVE